MTDFNDSLNALFGKMENFVSSKTVIGEPMVIGGLTIIPLVDVLVGVGAGSGGSTGKNGGGGGGLGAKICPSAVIVVQNGTAQLINVKNQDSVNRLIDMVPGVVNKLNFGPFKTSSDAGVSEVKFDDKVIIEPDNEADFGVNTEEPGAE